MTMFGRYTMRAVLRTCCILAGLLAGWVFPAGAADITLNETLATGEHFFIVENIPAAPSPSTNSDNYSVTVSGDDSGTSDDASFLTLILYASTPVEIENSGHILLTATGGLAVNNTGSAGAGLEAYGIFSPAEISNSGNITLNATAGTATASGMGDAPVEAFGINSETAVINGGTISVTGTGGAVTAGDTAMVDADTFGITSRGTVDNSGIIAVAATGGTAISITTANANADGYGIDADGAVTNTGDITVSATGGTASGATAGTESQAFGINSDGSVINSGAIAVTSAGGTATATDDESAFASGKAFGIFADGDLTNSGAITVTATGGTANAGASEPHALAQGLHSSGDIYNTGDITVTATYGNGSGSEPLAGFFGDPHAHAGGIVSGGGAVLNSGHITATAITGEAYDGVAVGILMNSEGTLTNTGVIQAFAAPHAYEVVVKAGTVTLVDAYNLNLDGDPAAGSLYVAGGASLDLNGATLSLTSVGDSARLNTGYLIFDTTDGGTVSGTFGALATPLNPSVVALYHDQATANSADDTVSLNFRPTASPQLEGVDLLRRAVTLSADLVGQRLVTDYLRSMLAARAPRLYAAAATVANDVGGRYVRSSPTHFFFTPYYANIDKETAPAGYDADLVGFVTGLERQIGRNRYGFHLGYGHAGLDFTGTGYSGDQEDQDLLSAGVHLMGNRDHWTWRGQLSGFYGWQDYKGWTGVNLEQREKADYDSYGVRTALSGGYLLPIGQQILLPEAGFEYLWLHRDSFTTDTAAAAWEIYNSSLDEHQLTALASVRWLTRLLIDGMEITPSLAAGLRCLLTDNDLDIHQSVAGSGPVTVKTEQDDVSGTVSASLRLRKDRFSSELAYGGEFGDNTTMHSAWLRFNYLF